MVMTLNQGMIFYQYKSFAQEIRGIIYPKSARIILSFNWL